MKSKTKIMTIAAASLACVAVAGVGFASWVITNTQSAEIQGNINVETVNDKSVVLTASMAQGELISFTHDGEEYDDAWLTQESDDQDQDPITEDLTASITFTISGFSNLDTLTATLSVDLEDATYTGTGSTVIDGYAAAIQAGYITAPTIKLSTNQGAGISLTQDTPVDVESLVTADGTITLTLTFGWGATFGGVNPAEFYNTHGANDVISGTTTYAQHAAQHLTALEDMLDGVEYKITFTPTANS